jgi:maleylacetoacetate isomerase/maleylpyruvate isomerase
MALILHGFWRATAPYRVRIGLALKGLAFDHASVDLLAGEQRKPAYRALNPQGLTPALQLDDGTILAQSLAILEYLDETQPEPPLLPTGALDRALVRRMAMIVACDIHPLNNARIGRQFHKLGLDQAVFQAWAQGWIRDGFDGLEPLVARHGKGFAFGAAPTIADCCLIPQVYSALDRFAMDISAWPAIRAVAERAAGHPAFQSAHPDRQPDAKPA